MSPPQLLFMESPKGAVSSFLLFIASKYCQADVITLLVRSCRNVCLTLCYTPTFDSRTGSSDAEDDYLCCSTVKQADRAPARCNKQQSQNMPARPAPHLPLAQQGLTGPRAHQKRSPICFRDLCCKRAECDISLETLLGL